jgi:hypothetical protein
MENDIIILDGKYEVHPMNDGLWAVVTGETGQVRNEGLDKENAIDLANELNDAK